MSIRPGAVAQPIRACLFAVVALAILAGCKERPQLSLICKGTAAYGITPQGEFGPWLMTSTGPAIGDPRGEVTGPAIPCGEAEKLMGLKAAPWTSGAGLNHESE